ADGGEGAAEHHGVSGKLAAVARDQVAGRAHRRELAVLIGDALAVDGGERAQLDLVPMSGDLREQPQRAADWLEAELLRQRDAYGLGLAIGMVGAERKPQPVRERDDD